MLHLMRDEEGRPYDLRIDYAAQTIAAEIDALTRERDEARAANLGYIEKLADIIFAAHMPDDYIYGLPSWINQHLYAAYIGAKVSPHIMQMIEAGTLTFPDSPAEKALATARAEVERLRPAAEAWEEYEQLRRYPMPPQNAEGEQVDAWHIGANKAREQFEAAAARARKETE